MPKEIVLVAQLASSKKKGAGGAADLAFSHLGGYPSLALFAEQFVGYPRLKHFAPKAARPDLPVSFASKAERDSLAIL